jgi:hypothetical protein
MKQHSLDLAALVFGVAFTLAGAIIILAESTDLDIGPLWGFAVVSIAVGVVTLLVTVLRARPEPVDAPPEPVTVSVASSETGHDVGEG